MPILLTTFPRTESLFLFQTPNTPCCTYSGNSRPQTVTFGPLSEQVMGDAPFSLAARTSTGQPMTCSILSGSAELRGNIVTITGSGLVAVRASVAADATHQAASMDQAFVASPGINLATAPQLLGNQQFYFRFYGSIGKDYTLQCPTDLSQSDSVAFQVNRLGYYDILEPTKGGRKFLRAVLSSP